MFATEKAWSVVTEQRSLAHSHWKSYKALQLQSRANGLVPSSEEIHHRNKLVQFNRNLARSVAHKAALECPEPYEDLEQIAILGLIKAIERFDYSRLANGRKISFSSFAVPYVRGEIQHFLRDKWDSVKVPRRAIEMSSKVKRLHRKMIALGREMDESVIATGIGISAEKWRFADEVRNRKPLVSIDEMLHLPGACDPVENDEYKWVSKAIKKIRDPERSAFMERAFGKSIQEIAKSRGVDPQQVELWCESVRVRLQTDFKEWSEANER